MRFHVHALSGFVEVLHCDFPVSAHTFIASLKDATKTHDPARIGAKLRPCCQRHFTGVAAASVLTQQRHKPAQALDAPRELLIAVPDMHSQVNLARIVRAAALFGVPEIIAAGKGRMDRDVSLGAEQHVAIRSVRSLTHPLKRLRADGWSVVGLEQTEKSQSLFTFEFPERTVLLVGHERHGIADELLAQCDQSGSQPSGHISAATTHRQRRSLPCTNTAVKDAACREVMGRRRM